MIGIDGKAKPFESDAYNEKAAVYGMALDPTSKYLYTADWRNGQIWTHKLDSDGVATAVGAVDAPSNVSAPRSIAIHPSGRSMYVVLEGWNSVALYTINMTSHLPIYSKGLYAVIPSSMLSIIIKSRANRNRRFRFGLRRKIRLRVAQRIFTLGHGLLAKCVASGLPHSL
jgi:hypothetical protein